MELILGYSFRIAAIVECLVVSAIALADSFASPCPTSNPRSHTSCGTLVHSAKEYRTLGTPSGIPQFLECSTGAQPI
jgi:hypothetical protein